ncbi:MAG: prepilin-type cleavage/methylation domain-containing protein [Ewingella sp.]|nr:prepilin-type cleavage/methylation domain-containing protein [Ewingella sp.]
MQERITMQKGFSLPEALIATLLLAVSLLALLQYYQSLSNGFSRQWQFRQAKSEAHAQLEVFAVSGKGYPLAVGWQSQITVANQLGGCRSVVTQVQAPAGYLARAARILCDSDSEPVL